ncbi:MAG: hypothetical protein K6G18_01030 [Treponema sp.]|nr:hypothetical protein [Treponema sp.]
MTFSPYYTGSTKSFYCEHLFDSAENSALIKSFTVKQDKGKGLAYFVRELAEENEMSGENRTYLVKDRNTHELAGYFALRTGLFTVKISEEDFYTVPSIELSNFAVNESYRQSHPDTRKVGTSMFYDFIIPLARLTKTLVGVQALYIYALPEDRLIEHYESLGFERLEEGGERFVHQHVKPLYDDGCIFMFQML